MKFSCNELWRLPCNGVQRSVIYANNENAVESAISLAGLGLEVMKNAPRGQVKPLKLNKFEFLSRTTE